MLMVSLYKLMDEFVNIFIYTLDVAWIHTTSIDTSCSQRQKFVFEVQNIYNYRPPFIPAVHIDVIFLRCATVDDQNG